MIADVEGLSVPAHSEKGSAPRTVEERLRASPAARVRLPRRVTGLGEGRLLFYENRGKQAPASTDDHIKAARLLFARPPTWLDLTVHRLSAK